MSGLGVDVGPRVRAAPRAQARIASVIWLVVSLPFVLLAWLHADGPALWNLTWRGWIFAAVALGCVLTATVVPPRYRLAILGTRVRAWGRLL